MKQPDRRALLKSAPFPIAAMRGCLLRAAAEPTDIAAEIEDHRNYGITWNHRRLLTKGLQSPGVRFWQLPNYRLRSRIVWLFIRMGKPDS